MTDRREFLQAGLAVSLLGGMLRPGGAAALQPSGPQVSPYKILVDEAIPESIAFGAEAAWQGAALHAFRNGDISDFWYHELDLKWRQQPAAIAGLTRPGPLFVLERFAWDRRMRVVFRAEHSRAEGGGVLHRFSGPEGSVAAASSLLRGGSQWTWALASAVKQCSTGCAAPVGAVAVSDATLSTDETLCSWLIA